MSKYGQWRLELGISCNRLIENTCDGTLFICTILHAISTYTQNDMSYESLIDSIDIRQWKMLINL
jgi:hypothetical protein